MAFACSFLAKSYGRKFFVAFPEASFTFNPLKLVIGSPSVSSTGYAVTDINGYQIQSGTVAYDSIEQVEFSDINAVTSSDFSERQKGLHVHATNDEDLYVLVVSEPFSGYSSFLTYPCLSYSREVFTYHAVSFEHYIMDLFKSQVLLVACQDNTTVTITPSKTVSLPQDAQDASSESVDVAPGTAHTLTLHQQQTLLVASLNEDITGTRIDSDRPLTVISGHQCTNVPMSVGFCEQLAVQIPPTFTWGDEFLLASYSGRTTNTIFKIVGESSTLGTYSCGVESNTFEIPDIGWETLSLPFDSLCYLSTSGPVFVVQVASGGNLDAGGDGMGDPVIAMVSPTTQYIKETVFYIPEQFQSNYISIFVQQEYFCDGCLLLDNQPVPCAWNKIYDSELRVVGYGCICNTATNGSHTLSHTSENGRFSAITFGFEDNPLSGYAYLTGMQLQDLEGRKKY